MKQTYTKPRTEETAVSLEAGFLASLTQPTSTYNGVEQFDADDEDYVW